MFSVPSNVGKLTVTARHIEPVHAAANPVVVLVRLGNTPTAEHKDAEGQPNVNDTIATVPLPAASISWYATLAFNETAEVNVLAEYLPCDENKAGVDCSIDVREIAVNPGQFVPTAITTNAVHYYKIKPATGAPIAVNVQSMSLGASNPEVYVRYGVLPNLDLKDYDIVGCTEIPTRCKAVAVRSSAGVVAENATWFIAVKGTGDGEYAIWNAENDTCPNNCTGNGECTGFNGGGVCSCREDFTGLIDCSAQTPRPEPPASGGCCETWEWVLIVIGIIIAAVILIGLAVYFVRRAQSRAGFERV
jgi:hypothetical protein